MPAEHQNSHSNCTECGGSHFTVIKKGFKGSEGLGAFLLLTLIMFGITWIHSTDAPNRTSPDYQSVNDLLFGLSAMLPWTGLLAGTRHMNDMYRICHQCGHETLTKDLKIKKPAPTVVIPAPPAAITKVVNGSVMHEVA